MSASMNHEGQARYSRKKKGRDQGRRNTALVGMESTPYEILGIPETASPEEIRQAYLRKVRLSPPEKDPEGFKEIRKAYGLLEDRAKKRELDLSLFKTTCDLDLDTGKEYDFDALFRQRLFRLLLSSSDLYAKDFSRHFRHMDGEVRKLQ